MKRYFFFLPLLFPVQFAFVTWALAQSNEVAIDAATNLGPIDLLIGTNAGPHAMGGNPDDYTALYQSLGIRAIRTHDFYGPCDWMTIFPDWSADPDIESSYHFSSSDSAINRIVAGGFEVLFRLGSSWRGNNPFHTNDPPGTLRANDSTVVHEADTTDFRKFANICLHIVMHYNDGWSNGFHYGIRRWEIWNEPSVREQFWSGTPIQFQRMYGIVAVALKHYDPSLRVGGPGQAGNTTPGYFGQFFQYCKTNNVPMDFYSWHSYGGLINNWSPWDLGLKASAARISLDARGFTATKMYCDEWNAGVNQYAFSNTGRGAAFYAAALTFLVEGGVAEAYQYRADNHPLGLVEPAGGVKIAAEAFRAWQMLNRSSFRISCTGTDTTGFTAIATKSDDGNTVRVLLSNFPDAPRTVPINISNFGTGSSSSWTLVDRVVDDSQRLVLLDSSISISENISTVTVTIQAHSVRLLELTRGPATSIDDSPPLSASPQLCVFPNPLGTSQRAASLLCTLPRRAHINVAVRDLLGRVVHTVADEVRDAGTHLLQVDASKLCTGRYLVGMQVDGKRLIRPITVLR